MEACSSERRFSVAEVHVLLEGSRFGRACSADCGYGKAPVCTGVSAYRVCRIACTQTVVMMVVVCAGIEDSAHLAVVTGSIVGGALIRTVL